MDCRDTILSAVKRRYLKVENVPLVGDCWIQSLTERERSEIETRASRDNDPIRALMILYCLVDSEGGSRLFGDCDFETLKSIDSAITVPLGDAIIDHITPTTIRTQLTF